MWNSPSTTSAWTRLHHHYLLSKGQDSPELDPGVQEGDPDPGQEEDGGVLGYEEGWQLNISWEEVFYIFRFLLL